MYYEKSKKEPWKTSILLRVLFIPITYKNYLIALMDVGFWAFFIPAIFKSYFYTSLYVVGGLTIKNFQDLIQRKIPY